MIHRIQVIRVFLFLGSLGTQHERDKQKGVVVRMFVLETGRVTC